MFAGRGFHHQVLALVCSVCCVSALPTFAMSTSKPTLQPAPTEGRLQIGKYQARAIWRSGLKNQKRAPTVIMIPGSGPQGPEEMMPPSRTLDHKEHSLFAQFAEPLNRAGMNTLALGKPGVEFFSEWKNEKWFYNLELYLQLPWRGYLENVREALKYVRSRADVDQKQIYLLGHSEGTQVAIDVAASLAAEDGELKGLILLGYAGSDMAETLDWQLFRRSIDKFVKLDVDREKKGYVTRLDAANWPEFQYPWLPGQERVTYAELEAANRADKDLKNAYASFKAQPIYQDGIFNRGPINQKAAGLSVDLFVFSGELDVQTPPEEAEALRAACLAKKKTNCLISIVPQLGHGFSPPRPPRRQRLLDLTLGPVAPEFQVELQKLAVGLVNKTQ